MKITIVLIVIGALGTITKGLLKGLEDLEVGGRVETIQMTALLRTARILRRVLETSGDLLSLRLHENSSANADVKNSNEKKYKWYMYNPAPVLENDMYKLLRDFDMQADHLISTRRPDLIIINNEKR